ncbi:hypothetical protein SERLADRAFT_364519 [Serpula lacrymans var. lacrymans S7.9]|uniref:Exocyst complex component Sec3 PIP2-binding N-terminal domain-containing protein n=1 Tax=Serpula lacrymans var. lacrymans (strain S7.9) TaxID=578457 RepID=F8NEE3_SERL9|nr:uncharacterized protein SERLADRAFT_364519 [Serpula lacrymans var. lacrymans S7.9]EGO30577.1 hypothetical protein SERLADRAFT_364519 [Serpula lacrymans var. lacrymans S7.9]
MADHDSVRRRIITSVFEKRNTAGVVVESYVAHIKIWEDSGDGSGKKPRCNLEAGSNDGSGFIHKSKLNTNGSFSVGKTWKLLELRGIEVVTPMSFNITLARTYKWQTENQSDQSNFITAIIKLYRTVTNDTTPLQLAGVKDNNCATSNNSSSHVEVVDTSRAQTAPQTPPQQDSESEKPPPTMARSPLRLRSPSRSSSPADSNRDYTPPNLVPVSSSPLATSLLSAPPYGANTPPETPTPNHPQGSTSRNGNIMSGTPQPRREYNNNRVSFFDHANQALLDRLVAGDFGIDDEDEGQQETVQAIMASVEDMLEGYEWASDDVLGKNTARKAADLVEARLLDELTALEKANIHSFLESDDRVNLVINYLDTAISEVDGMGSLVSSYKIHLNAVGDDIEYIQSQQRGLQVQTQNQRILLNELENLLQTVQVDRESLVTLTQESLEKPAGIQRLEGAATELYKALQAGRDTDMAATMARLDEYRTHNAQFCKRIFDFLSIMITVQSKVILDNHNGIEKPSGRSRPTIANHQSMESYLGRYAGLMLYLKEMDESIYSKLCATYFSAASNLHNKQIKALLSGYITIVKRPAEEDVEQNFSAPVSQNQSKTGGAIRRAGTIVRSPIDSRKDRDSDRNKISSDDMRTSEALELILEQIAPQIYRENDFIADFLQINDAGLTFADYSGLDNYFRRQAARSMNPSQSTMKLVRGAMDLIFGFLPAELKAWLDTTLANDALQIIGVLVCLERFLADADERDSAFLLQILEKLHGRLKGSFDRHVNQQMKAVEETKLTSKKRKGVAYFIKYFPIYITRIEQQLVGTDGLEIRAHVDSAYERIVNSMFDSLKQMATLGGDGEDKGQLNYHVILVENMHHFVAEISPLEINTVTIFLKQAESIYNDNLSAYVKIVLRRPFAKVIKVIKEFDGKDVRKLVDILFKRVEKHFTEASEKATTEESSVIAPGTVLVGVWKACEEELQRITELFNKRIAQCYADSGLSLEYTAADVEAAFRRHRLGS